MTLAATQNHTDGSVSGVTLVGTVIADTDFINGITVPSLVEGDNAIVRDGHGAGHLHPSLHGDGDARRHPLHRRDAERPDGQ